MFVFGARKQGGDDGYKSGNMDVHNYARSVNVSGGRWKRVDEQVSLSRCTALSPTILTTTQMTKQAVQILTHRVISHWVIDWCEVTRKVRTYQERMPSDHVIFTGHRDIGL